MRRGLWEAFMPSEFEKERDVNLFSMIVWLTDYINGKPAADVIKASGLQGLAANQLGEILENCDHATDKALFVLSVVAAFVEGGTPDARGKGEFHKRLGLR